MVATCGLEGQPDCYKDLIEPVVSVRGRLGLGLGLRLGLRLGLGLLYQG